MFVVLLVSTREVDIEAQVDRAARERVAHLVPGHDTLAVRPPTGSCTIADSRVDRPIGRASCGPFAIAEG
jgi:hypothetical protein